MTKEEILFLRNMLLDRRSSVLERVRMLAAAWQELEEPAIELEEEAQKASIAKPYAKLDQNGKLEIEQIDLALIKMSIGDYGVCESCNDDIAPKRLQAIPWARLCVDCARDFEKNRKTLPQTTEAAPVGKTQDQYEGLSNQQVINLIYERLHTDERIETEELKVSFRKGVVFLDGKVETEAEHDLILQAITNSMGFASVVDRMIIDEGGIEPDDISEDVPEMDDQDGRLFYDSDMHEEAFETKGTSALKFLETNGEKEALHIE